MLASLALIVLESVAGATEIGESRQFGLGIQLGDPSGITGKIYLGGRVNAVDFALGTYYDSPISDGLYVQAAYHVHIVELTSGGGVAIPFRAGIGGFFTTGYWRWDDGSEDYDVVVGARVPFGLDFDLERAPLQFYLEIAFDVTLAPPLRFGGDGGIGFRYYF